MKHLYDNTIKTEQRWSQTLDITTFILSLSPYELCYDSLKYFLKYIRNFSTKISDVFPVLQFVQLNFNDKKTCGIWMYICYNNVF